MRPRGSRLRHLRLLSLPVFFGAGWLFNFVYDIKFVSGFLSGWFMHSWWTHFF